MRRNRESVARCDSLIERVEVALDRDASAFAQQSAVLTRHSEALRDTIVELHDREERLKRNTEAIIGSLVDLAAEIRKGGR
jgi:predicted  nucleic acid-binding Zn-ribbon protein